MGFFDKLNPFKKSKNPEKEDNIVSFEGLSEREKWLAYFYPDTYDPQKGFGVMKNLAGFKDDDFLDLYENFSVLSNLYKLNDLKKEISIQHLKDIHKTLFQDVYSWAGEFRQVNMRKDNSEFVDYRKIEQSLEPIMQEFRKLNSVKDNQDAFSDQLCQIYLKLNNIHSFREGNGRTQNTFIKHVCELNGYSLDLQEIMKNMKEKQVDYYALFEKYNNTHNHKEIKEFLFDPHLVKNQKKDNIAKSFSETHKQLQGDVEQPKQSYTNKHSIKM